MPRTKSSPQKSVKTASNQPSVNTWVLLTKGGEITNYLITCHYFLADIIENIYISADTSADNDEDQSEIVRLGHPASDKPAMFLFGPGNRVVQEVLVFDEKKRSWFINDSVKSDGKLYLSTPIDPLFLVLPYLRKVINSGILAVLLEVYNESSLSIYVFLLQSQLAQPLEQCLWDEDFPDTSRLMQCKDLKLSLVADRKGEESLQAFKFNEDKSLKWLERKIEKVVNVLKRKGIHVSQNAVSATYVTSTKCDVATEAGKTR